MNLYKNAVAITGSIGVGKSTACNLLKLHGFVIIDADKVAYDILNKNVKTIVDMFGKECLKKDGTIDRRLLGMIVFNDKNKRKSIEKFMHPLIETDIINRSKKLDEHSNPYVIDIPLFYETKSYNIKRVVVVYASKETQLQRLVRNKKWDINEARIRIDIQMSIEKKREIAWYVIDNTKDLKHLELEIESFIKYLGKCFPQAKM